MKFFTVRMSHPDGDKWAQHVGAHVNYLKELISRGKVRASGRLTGLPLRSGFIIFTVADRNEVDQLVAGDPFRKENLIAEIQILEWDPLFGTFADESSGNAS